MTIQIVTTFAISWTVIASKPFLYMALFYFIQKTGSYKMYKR